MENELETKELVQEKSLMERSPLDRRSGKFDMTQGYMIANFGYSIVLLSRSIGILIDDHLEKWMTYFIETIRMGKMPIDWDTTLNENLGE